MTTDITALDHLVVVNLDIHIWTARKKLITLDLGSAELNEERDYLRASAEIHYPGLTHEIEPYLRLIPQNYPSTLKAFGFACEIAKIIRKYTRFMEQQQNQ